MDIYTHILGDFNAGEEMGKALYGEQKKIDSHKNDEYKNDNLKNGEIYENNKTHKNQ